MDKGDIKGRPVARIFMPHCAPSTSREKFRHSCDPRNRGLSCLCSTTLNIRNHAMSKHLWNTQKRSPLCFQLGHGCFCGAGQESVCVCGRTSSNKPAGDWNRIARKMTQKLEETSHPIFYCAESFLKPDLKSKKGTNTTQTQISIIRTILACNQLCICAAVCVCLDQSNQNKGARHREVPELCEADLTNLTHRKDLTVFGDRMRDSKDHKTIAQVSKEAGFSAQGGKGQYFVTGPSIKREGQWTLVCEECTLLRDNPDSKLVCALCAHWSSLGYENDEVGSIT